VKLKTRVYLPLTYFARISGPLGTACLAPLAAPDENRAAAKSGLQDTSEKSAGGCTRYPFSDAPTRICSNKAGKNSWVVLNSSGEIDWMAVGWVEVGWVEVDGVNVG